MTSATFVGWIPNVSGRLSFSIIGEANWPSKCHALNFRDGPRKLYCVQRRKLSDTLVPSALVSICEKVETRFWFLFVAESIKVGEDDIAALTGEIYIIEDYLSRMKGEDKKPLSQRLIAIPQSLVRMPRAQKGPAYDDMVKKLFGDPVLTNNFYAKCSVTIDRLGVARLSEIVKRDGVSLYSTLHSEAVENGTEVSRVLYAQMFYFLKDIAHKHKHHSRKHDTIVSVTEDDDDLSWARETMYGLHRKVIFNRRQANTDSLCDAQGIIAYMRAFQTVLKQDEAANKDKIGYKIADSYKVDQIDASIKAELEKIKIDRTQMNLFIVAVPVVLLALMNTFKPSENDKTTNIFGWIHSMLSQLFPLTLTGITLAVFFTVAMPFYYQAVAPHRIEPIFKGPDLTFRSFDNFQKNWCYGGLLALGPISYFVAYAGYAALRLKLPPYLDDMADYYAAVLTDTATNLDRMTSGAIVWALLAGAGYLLLPAVIYVLQVMSRKGEMKKRGKPGGTGTPDSGTPNSPETAKV